MRTEVQMIMERFKQKRLGPGGFVAFSDFGDAIVWSGGLIQDDAVRAAVRYVVQNEYVLEASNGLTLTEKGHQYITKGKESQRIRIHPIDSQTQDFWKTYPVRISGYSVSECCGKPTLLVQSMEGGFVTRNCPQCGSSTTLTYDVFFNEIDLWVACPECKQPMKRSMIEKNYGFACESCDIGILLATLLPRWEDLT